jgi:ribonuclease G
MSKEIVINVNPFETRVALLENNNLAEIFVERTREKGITGNIYKGRVTKILPGMQVAFVDIGLPKAGFLHQRDIYPGDSIGLISEFNPLHEIEEKEGTDNEPDYSSADGEDKSSPPIEDLLVEGQELIVQVNKDPINNKGARITAYITLPGRHLVFMPLIGQIGISRRIENAEERERLKSLVGKLRKGKSGYIIRTAAESATEDELSKDIEFLQKMWNNVTKKQEKAPSPALLHRDLDIVAKTMRDLFLSEVEKITLDSPEEYDRCIDFFSSYVSSARPEIELYASSEPIFDNYSLELEIERAIGHKVWLKSGGYIIIDQTEALTAIDVNTGKFVGKETLEETILKTNLEALKEIVCQLRLRNIAGLIIIDFIDMAKESSKTKVFNALEVALKQDRSRTKILQVSELGLVEMTRKWTRESLNKTLCQTCHHCDGRGVTKSPQTVSYEIFRELKKTLLMSPSTKKIMLEVPPILSTTIVEEENEFLEKLEVEFDFKLTIKVSAELAPDHYEISFF